MLLGAAMVNSAMVVPLTHCDAPVTGVIGSDKVPHHSMPDRRQRRDVTKGHGLLIGT